MAILVKKVSDKNYRVGNKIVYEDMEGDLISITELTTTEKEAFYNFIGHRSIDAIRNIKVK